MSDKTREERVEAVVVEIRDALLEHRSPDAEEWKSWRFTMTPFAERLVDTEIERDAARWERDEWKAKAGAASAARCPKPDDHFHDVIHVDETVEERPDGTTVYRKRCPHDGGACHHECGAWECFRESGGMALSEPHKGYPLPGHDALRARVERLEVAVAGHLARTNPGGYAGDWSVRELLAKEAIAIDVAKREEGE